MIVVVGSPIGRRTSAGVVAEGAAVAIGAAGVEAGANVELVGRVGDGADGDAILLSVANAGIGHVAVIRSVGGGLVDDRTAGDPANESLDRLAGLDAEDTDLESVRVTGPAESAGGPALDAGDIELALRYLPDYDVVVIAQPLDATATAAVVDAARWANARLVAIGTAGDIDLPADATVLEAGTEAGEGAFAVVVGRYAAALDRGDDPGEAFAKASRDVGWAPVGGD